MILRPYRSWLLLVLIAIMLVSLALVGCGKSLSGTISLAGSTTVQPIAEKLATTFQKENSGVEITVAGGGSAVGITSCHNGTVDIGMVSRDLKSGEPELVKHLIARDGIAIITSPDNPVTSLTKEQVRAIFRGTITKWKEIHSDLPDHDITVIVREEGSGTRTAFEELVMAKPEPAVQITSKALQQSSNGGVKTAVSGNRHAIGFISFGYVDTTVKALAIDGIAATAENAKAGTYPITRPLYFVTKEEPAGLVKEFIDFCLSDKGQEIVMKEGYISVT